MKKFNILKLITLSLLLLIAFNVSVFAANRTWNGSGDGTSWDDASNWTGGIPGTADNAIFGVGASVTITGTQSTIINGIQIFDNANITFDLDVTINYSSNNQGAVKIFDGSTMTLKTGRTMTITATNGYGIEFRLTNGNCNIEAGATYTFTGERAMFAINTATSGNTFDNSGTVNCNTSGTGSSAFQVHSSAVVTFTNNSCGVINTNQSIKIWGASSSLVNNGLIASTHTGAAVSVTAGNTGTNNAFFKSGNGIFSSGAGTSVDNGVDVSSTVALDAATGCSVDINGGNTGMQTYTWAYGGSDIATNAADGTLNLTGAGFPDATGPHTITISDANCVTNNFSSNFTVTVEDVCAAALPVELIKFVGFQRDAVNVLEWETASEENNAHFEIERSHDGIEFETLGTIQGFGTTYEQQSYSYIDETFVANLNYYRLKQVDFDGQFEYSDVITIGQEDLKDKMMKLTPNPVQNQMTVINGIGQGIIFNMLGQPVQSFNIQETVSQFDINELPNGQYFLRIIQPSGNILTQQFIKQ